GHGQYWFTAVDPATMQEFDQSPVIIDDARNTTLNQNPASAPASRNLQYIHRDHLGSTRLMTDENGIEIGRWKYFPFGMEAAVEESGDQRMKFTGHERDGATGLDYMKARSYQAVSARFLSPDPSSKSINRGAPSTWNRFSYTDSNPVVFTDPDGLIKYKGKGAQAYVARAKMYLAQTLAGKNAFKIAQGYKGSKEPTISINANHDDSYDPATNTINWDPTSGLNVAGQGGRTDSQGGTIQSAALGLFHELSHLIHHNQNPAEATRATGTKAPTYTNLEEKRATNAEKNIAKALDEPTRKSHGGTAVRTKTPTSKK
ncbi:MAG: RHS repeat-associated core domain-containing protein, partial [Acidobacteriota bacterium]|nr:RHS repeat-associated core domain-containing protein [Acidobacteriota bacterium]